MGTEGVVGGCRRLADVEQWLPEVEEGCRRLTGVIQWSPELQRVELRVAEVRRRALKVG